MNHCQETDTIAYFYFNRKRGVPGDTATCLGSLIVQLCAGEAIPPVALQNLLVRYEHNDTLPDSLELAEVLISLIRRRQKKVFVVIDALDEASGPQDMLCMAEVIVGAKLDNLQLVILSRLELEIKKCLEPLATTIMSVGGNGLDGDISLYIQRRIVEDPIMRRWEEPLKREIDTSLVRGAHGRYVI